jgi:predicted nucleotidyltransferase
MLNSAAARAFLQKRERQRAGRRRRRWELARRDAARIVSLIIEKYAPRRVYQWGSLLDPERFSEISDIDIAVEGLGGPERYFQLLGEADELTELPLDLVELERIHPLHAEGIRRKGKLVYERP